MHACVCLCTIASSTNIARILHAFCFHFLFKEKILPERKMYLQLEFDQGWVDQTPQTQTKHV